MADGQGRAKARGRGRARAPGVPAQEPPRVPGWGPPRPTTGPPPAVTQAPTTSGRATHRGAGRQTDAPTAGVEHAFSEMSVASRGGGSGNGGGGNGAPVGRGNMRGKRQINVNTLTTKPETVTNKKGESGLKVALQANYFILVTQTDWCLNQYRVDFAPSLDLTWERKRLLRLLRDRIGGDYIFDGTVMYCSHRIAPDPLEGFVQRESDDSQVRITIKLVGGMIRGDYHYLQFFNILTRKCLSSLNLQVMNRDYYDPRAKVPVPNHHLELWPGYKTVIRQHEQSVMMCAEITHKVMRTDTCYDLLNWILNSNSRDYKAEFTRAVVGSVVLTDYNNKTYMITDVNWNDIPSSSFDQNGRKVTYTQYYQERYNIVIRDQKQPLLVSKSKPRDRRAIEQNVIEQPGAKDPNLIYLIPELCRLTGLSDDMRKNFNLMKELAQHTRIPPGDRIQRLLTMNQRLNGEERIRREFQNWNMRLNDRLVDVPGRILNQETIVLGNNMTVLAGENADWTQHLRSHPMFVMPEGGLKRWVVLYPKSIERDALVFVSNLIKAARSMSFLVAEPEYVDMPDTKTQTYVNRLDQIISNMNPQLVLVVLMSNKADCYSAVKKKSMMDRAVPTQVLLAKNLNKPKGGMSIATKVAIQMNCKIGGAPWTVNNPLKTLMVVGFDVCHDSKMKGKSVGALVASLNSTFSRYFSSVSKHETGEEVSNFMASNIVKALMCYKKHNNTLPGHIIIYRDGVGDGQIPYVFDHEVKNIVDEVKKIYGSATPKIGFVIVCKRINTRLFLNRSNPPPGTVVDDVVTLPERYDFFIVSQYVNQGTVSPTSYNVIYDTLGLDPDKIQRLTYKLTHLYYNWSGTVRVPAPVQYAHKLAFLVSQSLHGPPNPGLQDLLYFL